MEEIYSKLDGKATAQLKKERFLIVLWPQVTVAPRPTGDGCMGSRIMFMSEAFLVVLTGANK